jgi:hypothetical protein
MCSSERTNHIWGSDLEAVADSDSPDLDASRSILKHADEHQLIYECLTLAWAVDGT